MVERMGSHPWRIVVTRRMRLGHEARLILLTRAPYAAGVSIAEFKRWKGAFDELVLAHDALIDEARDLREVLGEARDQLQQCLDAGERGHQVDVGELRLITRRSSSRGSRSQTAPACS